LSSPYHGNRFLDIANPLAEPAVAELVEASKPPPSLAFSYGRFDRLNDHFNKYPQQFYLKNVPKL